ILRYNDPRRFGAWLWSAPDEIHTVLLGSGPEPLTDDFNADYIAEKAAKRKVAVKQFIMDNKVVVGVGNIYANEALFSSRINPLRSASKVTKQEWLLLTKEIKQVLTTAIRQGGT
ncbi:DNA-formamidopyrimidine glycosylase, partial [Vibrio sp. 10N.261.45.F1]